MQTKARPSRSPMTLRAMRRDIAILSATAAVSITFSAWVHGQTRSLEAEPSAPARLHAAVAVSRQLEQTAVLARPQVAPLTYGEHFAFVVDLEEPYIVLATDVDASWEGSMDALLGVDTAFRNVDVPALPESLQAWTNAAGELQLATAFIDSPHVDTCGGFDRSFALGTQVRAREWALPGAVPSSHTVGPAFVGDLNADGFADMFLEPRPLDGTTALLQGSPESLRVVDTLDEIPYFGCRC